MPVTFVQTADAFYYAEMLSNTARTVTAYARRHGHRYEQFLGLKFGDYSWQATFNRVFLLQELLDRGHRDWVCYIDADAWVEDLNFDVDAFLADKSQYGSVFTPSQATDLWWDVNAGVFMINLGHPEGVRLAQEWRQACLDRWTEIAPITTFPAGGPDDQSLLHNLLMEGGFEASVYQASPNLINSHTASFIRQHLRSHATTFRSRVNHIRSAVQRVLNEGEDQATRANATEVVEALYASILGRSPDGGADNPYIGVVIKHGLRDGADLVARYLLDSAEFAQSRHAALNG